MTMSMRSAIIAGAAIATSGQWTLSKIDTAKYPQAVCLDGSPGAFYVSPGVAASFVLHLQGWVIFIIMRRFG